MQNETCSLRMHEFEEGPYEKALRCGVLCLSDEELLAILIRTGYRNKNALALSYEILQSGSNGLRNIEEKSLKELQELKGLGTVKALTLKAACELGRRISRAGRKPLVRMNDPCSIASYFMEQMRHETVEIVMTAFFSRRFGLISEKEISRGTEDRSFVSSRIIFREALRAEAAYIILLHNHPSGDPSPSREDYAITGRLSDAGELMGIPLIDHIVIGDNRYYSFKEHGEIPPREEAKI